MPSQTTCVCPVCARTMIRDRSIRVAFYAKIIGYDRPYEVYHADEHQCPTCKRSVITGFAYQPVWRHFNQDPMPECQAAVYENGMNLPTQETLNV